MHSDNEELNDKASSDDQGPRSESTGESTSQPEPRESDGQRRRGRGRGRPGGRADRGEPGPSDERESLDGRRRGGPRGPHGPRGHRRGRRHGRGDVRSALLVLIAEQPRHGYELMQEIGERTAGSWHPSPGSVYPALALLQDEGLVRVDTDESGRGIAALTDTGEAYVESNREQLAAVWDSVEPRGSDARRDASKALQGLTLALKQVLHVGTPGQVEQATKVVDDAQRSLYAILAQDPDNTTDSTA